jgi:hypothetical protein
MSKRKAAAAPADVPRKRVARFSPAFSDDEADAAAPPLDLPTDSEDESLEDSDVPLNEDDEPIDEDDGPAFAQYMAESDMEDEGEASSEEEDQLVRSSFSTGLQLLMCHIGRIERPCARPVVLASAL